MNEEKKQPAEGDDPGTMGSQIPLTPEQTKELQAFQQNWKRMNRHERRKAEVNFKKLLRTEAAKKARTR